MTRRVIAVPAVMLLCSITMGSALGQASAPPAPEAMQAPQPPAKPVAPRPAGSAAAPKGAQNEAGEPRVRSKEQDKRTDRVELDTTTVTGNRELPKVMYVVPWKKSDIGELAGKPLNSLLDEVLAPVDRDVFRREVTYFHAVNGPAGPISAPAGQPPPQGEK